MTRCSPPSIRAFRANVLPHKGGAGSKPQSSVSLLHFLQRLPP